MLSGIAFQYVAALAAGCSPPIRSPRRCAPDPYDVCVVDLVTIENTHQVGGGSVLPVAGVRDIAAACADAGVPLYLDGARIFNACAVTGATVADYAGAVTAMMFCLSKGLGAPIGSVLVGDREFIREARRLKILFGGAWRQAGIMAAAGLIALEEGPKRLHEDHANARALAEGIAELLPGSVDPDGDRDQHRVRRRVRDRSGRGEWREQLAAEGVLVTMIGDRIRMLTHVGIAAADIEAALAAWRSAAKAG